MTTKQILIVDDDLNTISLLSKMLERRGYTVQSTFDPFEGYRIAVENHFDLILLDIMMPNWSGFALCRELRLVDGLKDVPIYFVSAYTAVDVQDNTRNVGANGILFKPIRIKDIMPILETVKARPKPVESKPDAPEKTADTPQASSVEASVEKPVAETPSDETEVKTTETQAETPVVETPLEETEVKTVQAEAETPAIPVTPAANGNKADLKAITVSEKNELSEVVEDKKPEEAAKTLNGKKSS